MRILIAAFGTRGDVQPALALGKGLQGAGYRVTIAAGTNFQTWVESAGFSYAPIGLDVQTMMNSGSGKRWTEQSSDNSLNEARNMRAMLRDYAPGMNAPLWALCQDADVLVSGLPLYGFIDAAAQKLGRRHINLLYAPLIPSSDPECTLVPVVSRRSAFNRFAGSIGLYFLWWIFNESVNDFRRSIDLPALDFPRFRARWCSLPIVHGISPQVTPHSRDWHRDIYTTGYWFYDEGTGYAPPGTLRAFLEAGEPPVYLGFGSMANTDPQGTAQVMLEALRLSGQRGIIASGWAGLHAADLPPNVLLLDGAPHDWLFPRARAVVHHGGAGTTAAALRAGVPNTVVSHMGDQPYWGRRVMELGVGAPLIRRHHLNAARLAHAITQMTSDAAMQQRARDLATRIRAEDGVARAVEAFGALLG